jgi:hypothetical protein
VRKLTGLLSVLLVVVISMLSAGDVLAAEGWHPEQPISAPLGIPEPLGEVGDIAFWSPNRGALITAGVGAFPAGVYVYDGVGWHLYSTVCGGHRGQIAWAGPDNFWTVADQPPGQEGVQGEQQVKAPWNRSLCHFENGRVVASYAEPLGVAGSYPHLEAAACNGPSDCWFAGERLPGEGRTAIVNSGAFHLHWNGSTLIQTPSLTAPESIEDPSRSVADLAFEGGRFYESVSIGEADGKVPGEPDPARPSFIHLIEPGSRDPFPQLFPATPLSYGAGEVGTDLGPFRFAAAGEGLYAVAGAANESMAAVTLISIRGGSVEQVPLQANGALPAGTPVAAAAAEPGSGRIWVSFRLGGDGSQPGPTRIVSVGTDGSVEAPLSLLNEGGAQVGSAGPIACSALEQCWMATRKGWLFHLGGPLPRDEDPAMQGVISFRPADDSTPVLPPADLPEDDSGTEPPAPPPPAEILAEALPHHSKSKPLVSKVKEKVLGRTVLQISFTLYARAHVHLTAKWHGKVVAQTARLTLAKGPHALRLKLDPERWPTHIGFEVHPAATKGKAK